MRSERAVALPLAGNAAGEVSCARREPMVWVMAHAMSRRSRRVGVGSPLPAASAWMRDEAWASVASRSALAVWTVAGSRSAVVGCEHGLPCVGEGFGCCDERDDAVGVVGVHGSPSRCGCATPINLLYNFQSDLCNISMDVSVGFSLGSGRKAADRELIRASVATLVFPTESPLDWVCAHWPEGSLFGHWRSGMSFAQVTCHSTRRGVREHPAPSGALRRRELPLDLADAVPVREHPAPSGALRRAGPVGPVVAAVRSGSTQHHQVH